jgi:hypothetical protein
MEEKIFIGERKVSIKCNNHVIKIVWSGWLGGAIDIYIDDKFLMTVYGSSEIYKNVINPLVNGVVSDDILDCLKLIASTYRDKKTYTKYVRALARIGINVRKWIGRRPGAYLRRRADLIHVSPPNKYLLAFICNNGWIVVDVTYEDVYACIKRNDEHRLVMFDYDPITLADMLPELRRDVSIVELIAWGYLWDKTYRIIINLLKTIPNEWWRPLDVESLILEYQLKQL